MLAFHESANMFQDYAKACCKNHTKSGFFIYPLEDIGGPTRGISSGSC